MLKKLQVRACYMGETSTVAREFSHSMRRVQPLLPLSKEMVKSSTGDAVGDAFMSARTRSMSAPGYGIPHSPVFLLTISTHLSLLGTVKIVYFPTGTRLPPTIISAVVTKVVASLAPVRHGSP